MAFTEKTQAFLAAKYYEYLLEAFAERGKQAFIHAVKYYGMQRGSRMAQRVIGDGEPLNYEVFCRYGEWVPTPETMEEGTACVMVVKSIAPDFEYHISVCPWYLQFRDMGAAEAGKVYCAYLDEAINQGFNGEIDFHTIQTQHEAGECIFRIYNSGMMPDSNTKRIMQYVKGFDYHCAHTYYSFRKIIMAVFGEEGEHVCEKVLKEFEKQYGSEMTIQLQMYEKTDFDCCI